MLNQIRHITIKSKSDNDVVIEGYASVYNVVDYSNDIIIKGAFGTLEGHKIKLLWQHDRLKPIGTIKSFTEDNYGLGIKATINSKITAGKEAIEMLQQGLLDGLSIGFYVDSFSYNNLGQRLITKAQLVEVSIVTFPSNQHAQINNISIQNKFRKAIMNSELIIKDNSDIAKKFNHLLEEEGKAISRINKLEENISTIQSFLARPEAGILQDTEHKAAFNDYLRKGIEGDLTKKSFSSGEEEGGALITPALYHKIINDMVALSPMRQLASVETISSNALDIVIEDGKFASGWVGDADPREDSSTPKLLQKRIAVHELYAQPKATQRLIDDSAIQIENWLAERLKDSFAKAENEAFITGDGENKPTGLLTYAADTKTVETGEEVTPDLLLYLISELPEQYLANATFLMNRTTLVTVQKLKDDNGRFIWQPSLSESLKQTIFGIPVVCCSYMPSIAKGSYSIVLGDFKAAYKIVDRNNIHIMRDPYTDKPFVKFYAVKRVGGDVVNLNAIRLAKFN